MRTVFALVMAGSIDDTTEVVVDADDVVKVTGLPRDVVDAELAALVEAGGADAV